MEPRTVPVPLAGARLSDGSRDHRMDRGGSGHDRPDAPARSHEEYVTCRTYEEVAAAIRDMVIRGAPAIGVAAAMGVALGVLQADESNPDAQSGAHLRYADAHAADRGQPVLGTAIA